MRRPFAAAISLAMLMVTGALFVGAQLVPTAAASSAATTAGTSAGAEQDDDGDLPNDADMMFAVMMVPHHEQAIELSRILAATPGIDQFSTALAAFIERDQAREIADMQAWTDAWHRAGIMDHDANGVMAGMATPEQIAALDAAEGLAAEKLFLDLMIAHHEGALVMAKEVVAAGTNSYIRALAKHIASEQEREIEAMRVRREVM